MHQGATNLPSDLPSSNAWFDKKQCTTLSHTGNKEFSKTPITMTKSILLPLQPSFLQWHAICCNQICGTTSQCNVNDKFKWLQWYLLSRSFANCTMCHFNKTTPISVHCWDFPSLFLRLRPRVRFKVKLMIKQIVYLVHSLNFKSQNIHQTARPLESSAVNSFSPN